MLKIIKIIEIIKGVERVKNAKPDLNSKEAIACFVDQFYDRMLADPQLAPIFLDTAEIDLSVHLPHIKSYWCKLLLGDPQYRRHTMNIHRQLHAKRVLNPSDFERWITLFSATVDDFYQGEQADRAKQVARSIASNMQSSLSP